MQRIRSLSLQEFDPELRQMLGADHKSEREMRPTSVRAHHPELAKAYVRFAGAFKQHAVLSERLRELVRLRIAFHNQCRSCMAMRYGDAVADGVTEELVCSLEKPQEADDLTADERAALRFADLMANNHLAIDDATYAELALHFNDKAVVELGSWCALCIGFGRLAATWNMVEDLPSRFQAQGDGPVTPWGPQAWVTQSTPARPS
ncbi:MAG: carboxymuconolactone decarboxylase family protein [Betaproteobacteria bacterium]